MPFACFRSNEHEPTRWNCLPWIRIGNSVYSVFVFFFVPFVINVNRPRLWLLIQCDVNFLNMGIVLVAARLLHRTQLNVHGILSANNRGISGRVNCQVNCTNGYDRTEYNIKIGKMAPATMIFVSVFTLFIFIFYYNDVQLCIWISVLRVYRSFCWPFRWSFLTSTQIG